MRRFFSYLGYVVLHKWFVFWAGVKLEVPWSILFWHDWDKFLPFEFWAYANTFLTPDGRSRYVETRAFKDAWNAHQKRNKHHWQYWVLINDDRGAIEVLEMPRVYVREMLADWIGAGQMFGASPMIWYLKNKNDIRLHVNSRRYLEFLLQENW